MRTVLEAPRKIDALQKARGELRYTIDLSFPGMLWGKILRSPKPHAIILRIDARKARRLRGVKAVITYKECPQYPYNPIFNAPDPAANLIPKDQLVFEQTVRYIGAPVAAVAASDEDTAEEALELISVEYEDLPAVFDPLEALKPNASLVRPGHPDGNLAPGWREKGHPISLSRGNIEEGLRSSQVVFEDSYSTQRQHAVSLEPHVCICSLDSSKRLNIWSSTQSIFGLRTGLSQALGIPEDRIRVHQTMLGGAFGAKLDMNLIEPICALLALKTKRPVKMQYSREEEFGSTARHPSKVHLKTGLMKDGRIVARQCRAIYDCGSSANHGPSVTLVAGGIFIGAYKSPHALFEGLVVYTNNFPSGGLRGYGAPQVTFAVESQLDDIASDLGLDPIAFRLKNSFDAGDVAPTSGFTINTCGLKECASKAAERIGWYSRDYKSSGPNKKVGYGLAFSTMKNSGVNRTGDRPHRIPEVSGATVKIHDKGQIVLISAAVDQGGGQSTVLAQIAAEELGSTLDQVMVVSSDTDSAPFELATHASRVTYVCGYAVKVAASEARKNLFEVASEMLNANAGDLEVSNGKISSRTRPERQVSFADAARYARRKRRSILGTSSVRPPGNPPAFGVEAVRLEVDVETGEVQILNVVYAHDIGRAINRVCAEGQAEGGFTQGYGYACIENLIVHEGALANPSLLDYKIATILEAPKDMSVVLVETQEPTGTGVKSIAESAIMPCAAAIRNAIKDATGIRFRDLPITPEKILLAARKMQLA